MGVAKQGVRLPSPQVEGSGVGALGIVTMAFFAAPEGYLILAKGRNVNRTS